MHLHIDPDWRNRPDMHPDFTKRLRASVVARSRFVEDMVGESIEKGCGQYVILGAGLDTFAQRQSHIALKNGYLRNRSDSNPGVEKAAFNGSWLQYPTIIAFRER